MKLKIPHTEDLYILRTWLQSFKFLNFNRHMFSASLCLLFTQPKRVFFKIVLKKKKNFIVNRGKEQKESLWVREKVKAE